MTQSETLANIVNGTIKFCQLIGNALSAYHNWYIKNADTIEQYLLAFANLGCWYTAVDKMASHQIVFTGDLSPDLITEINAANNIDEIIENYYFSNNAQHMNITIARCQAYMQSSAYSELFAQTLAAYSLTHYHLACIGMFAIVDGVFADFSDNKKTGYKIRIDAIEKKISDRLELDNLDKKTLCICKTMSCFEESIFKDNYNFENEPSELNRHWVMHGRSQRVYTRYDFLKILLWLDAVVFLDEKINEKSQ